MSKPRNELPFKIGDEIEVAFETLAHGGACKGTPVGMAMGACAVFTHLAAPGDTARVRVREIKKNFVNADLGHILAPSKDRVAPPCPIFHECGGCDWQHVAYAAQMKESVEIARYVLRRAGVDPAVVREAVPSRPRYQYRTRGDLSAVRRGRQIWLGFRKRGSHDLVAAHGCPQFKKEVSAAFNLIRAALLQAGLEERKTVRVRVVLDEASGRIAVMPQDEREEDQYLGLYIIDSAKNAVTKEDNPKPFVMKVLGRELEYHPACFTQINPEVNAILAAAVVEALAPTKDDTVLELYSGIGNFTIPVATLAGRVIAVENARLSHEAALRNVEKYGPLPVRNVLKFARGACLDLLASHDRIDKVLADPPRSGLGEGIANLILDMRPARIVYVSCDITSLAADLRVLLPKGYALQSVTPFDMFPQTHHKEHIAILNRSSQ